MKILPLSRATGMVVVSFLFVLSDFAAEKAMARGKAEHVVVVVWDGMRPDFVSPQYTPTLYELAMKAYEEKTGARGLVSAVEKVLIKFEKRLPSTDIRKFVVTRAVVEDPGQELEGLLQDPSNPEMLEKFEALLSHEKMALKKSILNR